MERENERKELWHQLDNESDRAHEAFKVFMYLPPAERSVVGAWREWTGNPDAKREPPYFAGWARDHAWSDRARAHDHHLEVIRERGMEEAIREEAARQARQVAQVRGRFNELMAITYAKAIEYLEEDDFVTQLRPADVVQILKLHLETVHKLSDSGPEAAGSSATVDWSEDEQRELDAILDEIDAEEAHEEREARLDEGEEGPKDSEGVSD
jgi:hypothetical protein